MIMTYVVGVVTLVLLCAYLYDMWELSSLDNFENSYRQTAKYIIKKNGLSDVGGGFSVVVYIFDNKLVFMFPGVDAVYDFRGKKQELTSDFISEAKLITKFEVKN